MKRFLLSGVFCVVASLGWAATYRFDPNDGVFIDGVYGDRESIRAIYEEERARYQAQLSACLSHIPPYTDNVCDFGITDFQNSRVYGDFDDFEEYYQQHMFLARQDGDINTWRNGGLEIFVPSFGGFYPRGPNSNLKFGFVLDGGDADGPSNLRFSIPADERFVSIDLRVGEESQGVISRSWSAPAVTIGPGFEGTYYFDETFADVTAIHLNAWAIDALGRGEVGAMHFDNLVTAPRTANPAPVPIPTPIALLGSGLLALGALRLRKGLRQNS